MYIRIINLCQLKYMWYLCHFGIKKHFIDGFVFIVSHPMTLSLPKHFAMA